jgi:hypothetical protein
LAINDFSFSKESNQFNIKKLNLNNHTINIQTKNVSILEPALSNKKIIVKNIATESIDLSLNKSNEQKTSSKKKVSLPNFIIENIDLKNVSFALTDQASKLKVNLDFIKIQSLSHDSASYSFNNFNIKGHSLIYKKTNTSLILESFDLYKNNLSTLTNFQFTQAQNQDTLNISLPIIKEQIKWDELLKTKKLDIESFELNEPKIYYSKNNTIVNNANTVHKDPLDVTLKNLTIKNACVDICINQKNKKQQLHFPNINLKLKNVHQNTALDIQQIDISFNNWHLNSNQKLSIESSIHESSIQLSNVKHTKDSTQFTINDMQIFTNKIASINNGKETSLKNLALSVQNQKIKLPISNTIISNILDNKTFEIKHTNTSIETEDGEFFLHRMGFNNHQFTIDSISYIPKENEEKFNEKQAYQKDYIIVTTKKIKLNQIDIEKLYNKNELTIGEINIDGLSLYSYRDKRKPVMPYKYKALPTALINKITFPFDIKSISLTNAKILYKETSEKSELTGSIHFTDLNATITHITNIHTNPMDSLHMVAQTKLIGKSPVALKFTQSYKDTLSGFELNIQTGALDLTQLNQATEPLAGIKINSGHLESLKLHALGNDLYAIGKIEMPYKNLNITLSQHSDTTSANALGKVASLLANKLVVRTNNTKEGVVFFERIQNKSIFNFWFKLTMSGIMSSVGVKNSNRVIRHYNHYLKKNNLSKPEIDI